MTWADNYMDFMKRDLGRVLQKLRSIEPTKHLLKAGTQDGPIICLRQDRDGFKQSYIGALEMLERIAVGPRVKSIDVQYVKGVDDVDWGEYGRHVITIV